jgi:hypothetical protein
VLLWRQAVVIGMARHAAHAEAAERFLREKLREQQARVLLRWGKWALQRRQLAQGESFIKYKFSTERAQRHIRL